MLIDWIKSLFGRGKVHFEFTGVDRDGTLVQGDARAPYVGSWDEDAMLKYIKDELWYQHGVVVTEAKLVAHIQD